MVIVIETRGKRSTTNEVIVHTFVDMIAAVTFRDLLNKMYDDGGKYWYHADIVEEEKVYFISHEENEHGLNEYLI